jgi:hypothetical protein
MKYVIKRTRISTYNRINIGDDFKTIKRSELKFHLNCGWKIVKKIYPIITPVYDYWKKLNDQNKITIIGIICLPILFFVFDNYSNNKKDSSDSLKADSDLKLFDPAFREVDSSDLSNKDSSDYKLKDQILKSNDSLIN